MNELRAILDELAEPRDEDAAILATVVRVEGSSYRGVGARRLIARDGTAIGLVSGGCLEADIARQAWRLTEGGRSAVIRYDSTGPDGPWSFNLGCRGAIDLLLERAEGAEPPAWVGPVRNRLLQHETSALARVLRIDPGDPRGRVGSFLTLGEDGTIAHDLASSELAAEVADAARVALGAGRSGHATLEGPGGGVTVVVEVVDPPPTLIICGSGPDAVPVARLARELGWSVVIADGRHQPATRKRFPEADEVATLADPDRLRLLASRPRASAVVMTHNLVEDGRFLELLLATPIGYVGLLGPSQRAERLLGGLPPIGPEQRDRLHAPVGLDLGGETPAAIALAIVAEVQATLAERSGGPLRDRDRPIHDREPPADFRLAGGRSA